MKSKFIILGLSLLLITFSSFSQDTRIVSLSDGNKWFYHFYKDNGTNSRFEIKEVKGDTLIQNKEYKKIFVTSMGNDTTTRMQYWGLDTLSFYFEDLELVNWRLSMFYDIRIQQDTIFWGGEEEWGVHIDSVYFWGEMRATQKWYYDYDFYIFGRGSYTTTAYGYGPIKIAYYYWNLNTGGYSYTSNLVGAIIDGVLYGDTVLVSVEEINLKPFKSFYLSQNYPNPFNPSTTIRFTISDLPSGRQGLRLTTLKVYDLLGREVATLVNEEKPVGNYEVEFYVTGLPSGIYFYQVRVGDASSSSGQSFVETKKMVIIK